MAKPVLLVAEDDPDDALLFQRALRQVGSVFVMTSVVNGSDAIAYVEGSGKFADRSLYPHPNVLLLDLKMPVTDGFTFLRWRQNSLRATAVPTIVFSSSSLADDIRLAYVLGANSYVLKPTAPERLQEMARNLGAWWVDFNLSPANSSLL